MQKALNINEFLVVHDTDKAEIPTYEKFANLSKFESFINELMESDKNINAYMTGRNLKNNIKKILAKFPNQIIVDYNSIYIQKNKNYKSLGVIYYLNKNNDTPPEVCNLLIVATKENIGNYDQKQALGNINVQKSIITDKGQKLTDIVTSKLIEIESNLSNEEEEE